MALLPRFADVALVTLTISVIVRAKRRGTIVLLLSVAFDGFYYYIQLLYDGYVFKMASIDS